MPKELFNQGTVDEPSASDRFALSVPGATGGKNLLYSKLKEIMRRGAADTWTSRIIETLPAVFQVGEYLYILKDTVPLPFESLISPDVDTVNFVRIGRLTDDEVISIINGRTGDNRVDASAIKNLPIEQIQLDPSGFDGNLSPTDDTLQKIAQKVDDLQVSTSEVIDVNGLDPYDPAQAYTAGVYRSYVNLSSPDPKFRTPAIYQAVYDVAIGQTPETHPYNPETETGLWWWFGDTVEATTRATARGYCETTGELSLITGYKHNDSVNVKTGTGTVAVYVFDSASTSNHNTFKPADIATGDPGRWRLRHSVGSEKSYTIDYPPLSSLAADINMLGAATITNIAVSNVTNLWLTYSGGTQVPVTPGDVNISITAGETLIWEIGRTTDGLQAAVGVKLIIN